jgi:asparagine synthase (glutamine-hydrolysing)
LLPRRSPGSKTSPRKSKVPQPVTVSRVPQHHFAFFADAMSAIAGIVDLAGSRPVPSDAFRRMSGAMLHRGQQETFFECPGLTIVERGHRERRENGNSDSAVVCALDGQIYNSEELRTELDLVREDVSIHDDQVIVRLWKGHGKACLDRLRGQFALALWDKRTRQLVLARDHFGVCPLHWTRQGDWLLFASEIKALLASGMVMPRVDLRGLHHVWTFFGVPGPVTCFEGVSALLPGHYLEVKPGDTRQPTQIHDIAYWQMNFPDQGDEDNSRKEIELVNEYEAILLRAIEQRLCGQPPTVAYSSGGLDSSLLVSMATRLRGGPLDSFTFRVPHPHLDETSRTADVAGHVGNRPEVVELTGCDLVETFPALVQAAESPVIDVSAAALLRLAERVHERGHRAVLTGEGADEFQAGYPWFRIQARLDRLDRLTHLPLSRPGFRAYVRLVHSGTLPWSFVNRSHQAVGGRNAWLLAYMLMATTKHRFFSRETIEALGDHLPLDDLQLDHAGLARWHPLNRSIYLGARVHLPGLHLAARGDRAAGRSGIETRYPFLDRELFDFLAPLDPSWKLRGLEDKYLQRRLTNRWLPRSVTAGHKKLLHAPLDAYHRAAPPAWAEQLLSPESLRRAGYFDPQAVQHWRKAIHQMRNGFRRLFIEMGLVGVLSTQLWHQQFIDPSLADVT